MKVKFNYLPVIFKTFIKSSHKENTYHGSNKSPCCAKHPVTEKHGFRQTKMELQNDSCR